MLWLGKSLQSMFKSRGSTHTWRDLDKATMDSKRLQTRPSSLVYSHSPSLPTGAKAAAAVLDDGGAGALLDRWIAYR